MLVLIYRIVAPGNRREHRNCRLWTAARQVAATNLLQQSALRERIGSQPGKGTGVRVCCSSDGRDGKGLRKRHPARHFEPGGGVSRNECSTCRSGPAFVTSMKDIVEQRIHACAGDVGIRTKIRARVECRRRVAPHSRAKPKIVLYRIHSQRSHVGILLQIPLLVELARVA